MIEERLLSKNKNIDQPLFDTAEDLDINIPQEFLPIIKENGPLLYDQSKKMLNLISHYKEIMMMYNCALKEIRTRFEILDAEFSIQNRRNPINSISTRLKSSSSLVDKMQRNNIPFSLDNITDKIDDIAGIRVICSYIDDIYLLSQALVNQSDIEPLVLKDYIVKPKANGYRSLHMIVKIPIHFENSIKHVKVEVQIRTIAMDFWATLEHDLIYKNQLTEDVEIAAEVKECADIITKADSKMLEIRKRVEKNISEHSDEDDLMALMKKIDLPI